MRIISQDGNLDLPYEHMIIERLNSNILCKYHAVSEKNYKLLAEYSNIQKAEKAMELLQQAYTGIYITNEEVSEDFDKTIQELMKHGFGTVVVRDRNDSTVEFDNLNGYFRFPYDEALCGRCDAHDGRERTFYKRNICMGWIQE